MKNQKVASPSTTFCLLFSIKHCGISYISQIEKVTFLGPVVQN